VRFRHEKHDRYGDEPVVTEVIVTRRTFLFARRRKNIATAAETVTAGLGPPLVLPGPSARTSAYCTLERQVQETIQPQESGRNRLEFRSQVRQRRHASTASVARAA
jgi:hypothetical protein